MVFQSPAILPWLNVFQNLLLPLQINPSNDNGSDNESLVGDILSIIQMEEDAVLMSDRIIILSKSPGTFSTEIKLDFSSKRTHDLEYQSEFLSYVNQVKKSLSIAYDFKFI